MDAYADLTAAHKLRATVNGSRHRLCLGLTPHTKEAKALDAAVKVGPAVQVEGALAAGEHLGAVEGEIEGRYAEISGRSR